MSLDFRLALRGQLRPYSKALTGAVAVGAMAGAKAAENEGKRLLRGDVMAAGLGQRLANTWRARTYPTRGVSLTPAVAFWSNANHIKRAFEEGSTIRSSAGFWLAIPTDEVPDHWKRGSRNFGRITPGILEKRMGIRLRHVPISPTFALLVADKVRRRKGKRGGFAKASARALKKGDFESPAMFILVPQVRLKKRLNVAEITAELEDMWPDLLQQGIDQALTRIDEEFSEDL